MSTAVILRGGRKEYGPFVISALTEDLTFFNLTLLIKIEIDSLTYEVTTALESRALVGTNIFCM